MDVEVKITTADDGPRTVTYWGPLGGPYHTPVDGHPFPLKPTGWLLAWLSTPHEAGDTLRATDTASLTEIAVTVE